MLLYKKKIKKKKRDTFRNKRIKKRIRRVKRFLIRSKNNPSKWRSLNFQYDKRRESRLAKAKKSLETMIAINRRISRRYSGLTLDLTKKYRRETFFFLFSRFNLTRRRHLKYTFRAINYYDDLVINDYKVTFFNMLKTFYASNTGIRRGLVRLFSTHPLTQPALLKKRLPDIFFSFIDFVFYSGQNFAFHNLTFKSSLPFKALFPFKRNAHRTDKFYFFRKFQKLNHFSFLDPLMIKISSFQPRWKKNRIYREPNFHLWYFGFKFRLKNRYKALKKSFFKKYKLFQLSVNHLVPTTTKKTKFKITKDIKRKIKKQVKRTLKIGNKRPFFIKKPIQYKLPLKKKRKKLRNSIRKFSRKIRALSSTISGFPRRKWHPRGYFNLFCKLTLLQSPLKITRKKRKIKRSSNVGGVGMIHYKKVSRKKVVFSSINRKKINTIVRNLKKKPIQLFKGRKRILSILRKICKSTSKIDKISKTSHAFTRKNKGIFSNMRIIRMKRIWKKRQRRRLKQIKRRGASIIRLAYKLNEGRYKTGKLFYKIPNIFWKNFLLRIRKLALIYNFSNKRSVEKIFFKMIQSNKDRARFMKVSHTYIRKELKRNKHNLL